MVSRQLLANQIDFPRIRTPRPPEKPSPFSHNLCGPEVPEVFWRAEKLAPQQWKLFTFNESGNLSWFMTVKKNFRYSFVLHIITVCHFWLLEECQQWSSSCVVTNRVIVAPCTACKNMIFFCLPFGFDKRTPLPFLFSSISSTKSTSSMDYATQIAISSSSCAAKRKKKIHLNRFE